MNGSPVFRDLRVSYASNFLAEAGRRGEATDRCWRTIPTLVPSAHLLADTGGGVSSSQGAGFSRNACPGWAKCVHANACGEAAQTDCDMTGNAIFDGGEACVIVGTS